MNELNSKKRVLFRNETVTPVKDTPLSASYCSNKLRQEFLEAVKAVLKEVGSNTYEVHSGKPIEEVTSLTDVTVYVERLLNCGWESSGQQTLRYAIASIYNDVYTAEVLHDRLLASLEEDGYIKIIKKRDYDSPKMSARGLFGSACHSLDTKHKEILCKLMLNYQGW